jgi:hypothetical protein
MDTVRCSVGNREPPPIPAEVLGLHFSALWQDADNLALESALHALPTSSPWSHTVHTGSHYELSIGFHYFFVITFL